MDRQQTIELLLHISSVQDERKYLSVAQGVIDFRPEAVTMINEAGNLSELTCLDEDQTLSSGYRGDASNVDPGVDVRPESSPELQIPSSQASPSLHNSNTSTAANPVSITDPYRPPWLEEFNNPPYRNPFHARRSHSACETPVQTTRPRTAPEILSNIQVPFTVAGHKRSYSEANLQTSFSSRISNSQPTIVMADQEMSLPSSAPPPTSKTPESIAQSLSQASLQDKHEHKRPRLDAAQDTDQVTTVAPPVPRQPSFLRDRSADWNLYPAQPSPSEESSVPSTATPSQPLEEADKANDPASQKSRSNNADSPIVVTSSSSASRPETPSKSKQSPPAARAHEVTPESRKSRRGEDFQSAIDALPQQVTGPEPPVGDGKFTTHITQGMLDITMYLSIEDWFRPLGVTRDVKVLERGYWTFDVTITLDEKVERLRRSPTKEEKFQMWDDRFPGASSKERLDKYFAEKEKGDIHDYDWPYEKAAQGLWTKAEFLEFWNSISTWMSKGRGGWGIRMVRDRLDTGQGEEEKYRVRIFCWGEVLAHIHIVIWIMSNKVTERVSMQWIAGDGTVVVQMRTGRLRQSDRDRPVRWIRKGPDGERGSWGIAEA